MHTIKMYSGEAVAIFEEPAIATVGSLAAPGAIRRDGWSLVKNDRPEWAARFDGWWCPDCVSDLREVDAQVGDHPQHSDI